nr:MAG TPA: hypothetical protein [Caudoviricetes sp.]
MPFTGLPLQHRGWYQKSPRCDFFQNGFGFQ